MSETETEVTGRKGRRLTPEVLAATTLESRDVAPTTSLDYSADAGAGMEGIAPEELLVPIHRILHYQCPEIDEHDSKFIIGAKPGMILNTATQEVYPGDAGILFVPCDRKHEYHEFVDRTAGGGGGGGFRGVWAPDDSRLAALQKSQGQRVALRIGNGRIVRESWVLSGVAVPLTRDGVIAEDVMMSPAIITFYSTQIRKYRAIVDRVSRLVGAPPKYPMWAWAWELQSQPETNDKGKFFGWRVGLRGGSPTSAMLRPDDPLYMAAKELYLNLKSGKAQADYSGAVTAEEDADQPSFG